MNVFKCLYFHVDVKTPAEVGGKEGGQSRNKQRGISNFFHHRLCGHLLKPHKSSEMAGWMFWSLWCQLADFPHELTSCFGIFQEPLWFNLNYLEVIIPLVTYQGLCFLSISFLGTCFLKSILILINTPNLGKRSSVYFNKHFIEYLAWTKHSVSCWRQKERETRLGSSTVWGFNGRQTWCHSNATERNPEWFGTTGEPLVQFGTVKNDFSRSCRLGWVLKHIEE